MARRRAISDFTEEDTARFWVKVQPPNEVGCMLWTSALYPTGYGAFQSKSVTFYAHRVALTLSAGEPPEAGMQAAHACRNRHCVAPEHLAWATQSENEIDKVRDGTHRRGSRHPLAKLIEADVREIRALVGIESGAALARRFGISPQQVCDIVKRRSWKHI